MTDITIVVGTRPEAIKLAPVVLALREYHRRLSFRTVLTGQHAELTNGIMEWFSIEPDDNLGLMEPNQTLSSLTAKCITSLYQYLQDHPSRLVLVQGDTTTAFAAGLAAFYHKIRVGHVEAGLRTLNRYSPWPEELNRRLLTQLADFHFAPTAQSVQFLLHEAVRRDDILLSGNTVIDALEYSIKKVKQLKIRPDGLQEFFDGDRRNDRVVLITGHRRENFGEGFESICGAIRALAERYPRYEFVYPVHLNPNVRKTVFAWLGNIPNIRLLPPLEYPEFVSLMERSYIILTDSGGVQEEAPSLHKPVIVFRENTERPEAVEAGLVVVVGTDQQRIIDSFVSIADNPERYATMASGKNPYGDGLAAKRIVEFIAQQLP